MATSPDSWQSWASLAVGFGLLALASIGSARRMFPGKRITVVIGPIIVCSLLPLVQIFAEALLGAKVTATSTYSILGLILLWGWWPQLRNLWAEDRSTDALPHFTPWATVRQQMSQFGLPRREVLSVVGAALFVAGTFSLVHVPAENPVEVGQVPVAYVSSVALFVQGADYPYPMHVDEFYHIAAAAQLERSGELVLRDPYTGELKDTGLFSISGLRSERGFELLTVQLAQLTGQSLPTIYHYTPALMGAYLAVALWAALRPAPGAAIAPWLLAVMPTNSLFLGPGLLIPSTFGLPWICATMLAVRHAKGTGRWLAVALLITGAHFIHINVGAICIITALATIMTLELPVRRKVGLAIAVMVPLIWLIPPVWLEAIETLVRPNPVPPSLEIVANLGIGFAILVAAGTGILIAKSSQNDRPTVALAMVGGVLAALFVYSHVEGTRNDGLYARLFFAIVLCAAAIAAKGLSFAVHLLSRWRRQDLGRALAAAAVALALVGPLATQISNPMYQIHDAESWQAGKIFAQSGADDEDIFLSHPWRAPIYNAATGAIPLSVLYPGKPPVGQLDWEQHVGNQTDSTWYEQRTISYIIGPPPTGVEATTVGPEVYKIVQP